MKQKIHTKYFIIGLFIIILVLAAILLVNRLSGQAQLGSDTGSSLFNTTPYKAPDFQGIDSWINTAPLSLADLKGKVVLVDFWTYSCINCLRELPYIKDWYNKYKQDGLVVVGIHTPEFSFEHIRGNVEKAVSDNGITYPVGQDNEDTTWQAFQNQYWPAEYFIDRNGLVRHIHSGEGDYSQSEAVIQALLAEGSVKPTSVISTTGDIPPISAAQSPETYLGYLRSENFVGTDIIQKDANASYTISSLLTSNQWSLGGNWKIGSEDITSDSDGAVLSYNFSAKDVYLVMGADSDVTVSVKLNGKPVTSSTFGGADVDSKGLIHPKDYRLYKIIKLDSFQTDQILELTFSQGAKLNAFTFGS